MVVRGQGEEIELLASKYSDWVTQEQVPEWIPDTTAPIVYCDHVKDDEGKFRGLTALNLEELEEEKLAELEDIKAGLGV